MIKQILNKLRVYQLIQINYSLIDRTLVIEKCSSIFESLKCEIKQLDSEAFLNHDLEENTIYFVDEIGQYLFNNNVQYLFLNKLFDLKHSQSYCILLNASSTDLPTEYFSLIPTIYWPLSTIEEIASIFQEVIGISNEKLIRLASGLSYMEIYHGLKYLALTNVNDTSSIEKELIVYKQEQLKRLGLDFLPVRFEQKFAGLDLLRQAIEHIALDYSPRARELGLPLPKGWLLVGPPGTGKTFAAKCCAGMLNVPLLMVGVEVIRSKGAAYLKSLLQRIEAVAPVVAYFDEFDKFFDPDTAITGSAKDVLGVLLTWFQEKTSPTFVIATLNRLDALPPELTRAGRFDKIFYVDFPHAQERKDIIMMHASKFDPSYLDGDPMSYEEWMVLLNQTHCYTGAELQAIVVEAARRKYREDPTCSSIALKLQDFLAAREDISSLFSRDPDRVLRIKNNAQGISSPASSPDRSIYAPQPINLLNY